MRNILAYFMWALKREKFKKWYAENKDKECDVKKERTNLYLICAKSVLKIFNEKNANTLMTKAHL